MHSPSDVIVYEDSEHCLCKLEFCGGHCFVHIDMKNESIKSLKYVRKEFPRLLRDVKAKGFDFLFSYTPNFRFAKMIGHNVQKVDELDHNGELYQLVSWDLEGY